jgi:hypothetical protein
MSRYLTICRWCGMIIPAARRTRTTCGDLCRQKLCRGEWQPRLDGPDVDYWLTRDALRWGAVLQQTCLYLGSEALMMLLSPSQRALIKGQQQTWAWHRQWRLERKWQAATGDRRYKVNQHAC